MRRIAPLVLAVAGFASISGCGAKDPELCDFNQSLGAAYTDSDGYIPSDIQADIDEYC